MDATHAIQAMLKAKRASAYTTSTLMGYNENYIPTILRRGSSPRVDTFAAIADACGYDLVLMPRDGAGFIVVDGGDDAD